MKIGSHSTLAMAINATRTIMPEIMAKIFNLSLVGFRAHKTMYTPTIVENSAKNFINPLKGFRNDMLRKATKLVTMPAGKPNKKYASSIGTPIKSNFKKRSGGNHIFKPAILNVQSKTATTAPKSAALARTTLFRLT